MARDNDRAKRRAKVTCANCFVCKEGSEFCPKSEKYNPDAYLRIEARLKENEEKRRAKKQGVVERKGPGSE